MNNSLFTQLHDYLISAKGEWPTVARDCGVDKSWIYKFVNGGIKDPGVLRTEKILSYAKSRGWKPAKQSASRAEEARAA